MSTHSSIHSAFHSVNFPTAAAADEENLSEVLRDSVSVVDSAKSIESVESVDPIKSALKYHFNWCGWPAALGFLGFYGYLIYCQVQAGVPEDFQLKATMEQVLSLRYVGSFIYFAMALLSPSFIYEQHNAEAPLLLSTLLQLHWESSWKKPVGLWEMILAVGVAGVHFMRRKPKWRCFLNPWIKDKTELKRLIALARAQAADL